MHIKTTSTALMIICVYPCTVLSAERPSIDLSLGYLSGEAKEYVYNGSEKLSELSWKTNNSAIIKAQAKYPITSWLDINFSGWSTIASGSGSMKDQDWKIPDIDSSLNSIGHSPSKLNYANMYDLGVTGWLYQNENAKLGVLVGYTETRYSWTSHDGYFEDFDDQSQSGPLHGAVIGYKQNYKTPYIGATAIFDINNFSFTTAIKYSTWVKAKDYDVHYLRKGFVSEDESSSSEMYTISQEVAYKINNSLQVTAEVMFNQFKKTKADTHGVDDDGKAYFAPGDGGLGAYNYTISAGIKYNF
ncbi:TPA: omptin family outer membrane protease [Klebsiella quasipneumoniae subsp. quasipneumoniae]|nr:omptin family outer membrane protease [Klebsiella quasipneumoniae subsp. quasipneumoniae]